MLQKIGGSGRAFVDLSGEVIVYDLVPGQTMRVHPGHAGLFQASVSSRRRRCRAWPTATWAPTATTSPC